MALAASLIPGLQYRVESGLFEGEIVTIVDNTPFPDDDFDRRRKVTVKLPGGDIDFILPRMLGNSPVGAEVSLPVTVVNPTPAPVRVVEPEVAALAPTAPLFTLPTMAELREIEDPMDPRLDAFRPRVSVAKRYISRTMPDSSMSDIDFLLTFTSDEYRAENDGRPANIMLKGETQSGKSMLVNTLAVRWAERMGLPKPMPVFTLTGSSGVTDFDLYGQTTVYNPDVAAGQESMGFLRGLVELASRGGGILHLEEVNAMLGTVVSSLHPLADHQHMFINRNKPVLVGGLLMPEVVKTHLDLWIIATFNEGYAGMGEVGKAFINRFRVLPWDYDTEVEARLVTSPAIRVLAQNLRLARDRNKIRTPVGTAALQRLERDVRVFGIDLAMRTFKGMFPKAEVGQVEDIIKDRSILIMLREERKQADANQAIQP